jgi:shikimate kinase
MTEPPALPVLKLTRTVALVGLMGVGKTSVGKRLAAALGLPFRDADHEIELAAGQSVADIFADRGEAEFRDGERRVIARLLDDPPHVLATGGGAFVQAQTRALINARAVSIWLKADVEILARRVARKGNRPLLLGKDPIEVLNAHVRDRYPFYAQAHLTVEAGDAPHAATVEAILKALAAHAESVAL